MIVLLRHASAGDRRNWHADDRLRPLDEHGRRDAEELVRPLRELGVQRLVSSPYLRCVQTLDPLARALCADVECDARLGEGAPRDDVLEIAEDDRATVLCTHGDVVEAVLGRELEKGAFAVLA